MKPAVFAGIGAVAALALFMPLALHEETKRAAESDIPAKPEASPTLLFVGDIMLDRDVARFARREGAGSLFSGVQNIFADHNLVIGNLEGTITNNPSLAEASSTILRFTFAPQMAEVLAGAGITTVSLANNHSLDFGQDGYRQTRSYLNASGIGSFGSGLNDEELAVKTTVDGTKVCFVGYHELFRSDPSPVVEKLKEIEPECDYRVVFAHWGNEYEHEPSAQQRELAHLFVDNGADLVIGAHPHVVEPLEIYKNTAIFYSLGNFVFDQGWNPEVRRGVMVSVELTPNEQRFTLIPTNTYLQAALADDATSEAVLADLGVATSSFVLSN